MDNGLVQEFAKALANLGKCLNPCCSGQWSSTSFSTSSGKYGGVLILIVVDDGLVPMTVQRHTTKPLEVLIFVVVDNGLVQQDRRCDKF